MDLVLLLSAEAAEKFMEIGKFIGAGLAIGLGVIGPWHRHWCIGRWSHGCHRSEPGSGGSNHHQHDSGHRVRRSFGNLFFDSSGHLIVRGLTRLGYERMGDIRDSN